MADLRETPIYQIGSRYNLLVGCDRELLLFTSMLYFLIPYVSPSVFTITASICLFSITLTILRLLAKSDPLMKTVFLQHIRYKDVYLAKSCYCCNKYKKYK